jgi:tripartite-type tricarboxylate transporter receptor subunit TctC
MKIHFTALLAVATLALVPSLDAKADEYPGRVVKIVLPYPPGGSFDGPTRLLASRLTKLSGQPFVVENRGGAGGAIAANEVLRASPDGYTLLVSSSALPIASTLMKSPAFDSMKDFRHVATFAIVPIVLAANPKRVPFSNLQDFVEASRAAPGKYTYASAGNGSTPQLGAELLRQAFGVEWLHIPYKGSGPAVNDLIGGQVDISVIGMSAAQAHIRSGALKALAVTGDTRSSQLPEVPTVSETFPGVTFETWMGFSVPARTPRDVSLRLAALVEQAIADPELRTQLTNAGVKPLYGNSADTTARVANEVRVFTQLGKRANISLD